MKYSFSLLTIAILSFIIVHSCSSEEDDTIAPNIVQTPEPEPPAPTQYSLTVTAAEGGTVSTEGGTYDEGTEVTITATPSEGYRFTGWEGNDSTSESLTITLNSNQTYQAQFELIPIYTLTVTIGEGGTVSSEGGEFVDGTEIEITATANEGYRFTGWEGNDSTNETLTITLNSNQTYQALFELIPINTTDINNDPDIFSYDTNIDYTEQIVDFYPNAFFTSDLSEKVVNGINLALKTAADAFGKYGPVEYWVFGSDKQAALDLINKFCERRVALNQWSLTDCLNRETDESLDYSMIAYQKIGEEVISTNQARGGAGHNGGFQWGIHRLSSSYPFSFDNLFEGIPPQDDFKTVLHEYFHVFQLANVFNLEREERDEAVKPNEAIWMQEGGAEYMANYTLFKLINNGTLSFEKSYGTLREKMRNKMDFGKSTKAENCPSSKLNQFTYQECNQAGYELGSWGVAFLINKVNNPNILLDTFYPNLKQLGFEDAFNLSFGYSAEEFYQEFDTFLELPIEQQLEIIPDI